MTKLVTNFIFTYRRHIGLLEVLLHIQENEQSSNNILWRDITIAEDPDQPYDERLQLFAKARFGLAADIPFTIRGFKGIVIFFANPHADAKKLRNNTNSQLIQFAAQFIGSAAAVQNPSQNAKLLRMRRPISNWKILRVKILAVIKFLRPIHIPSHSDLSPMVTVLADDSTTIQISLAKPQRM